MFAEAKSSNQLIKLFGEAIDGDLTPLQQAQLRFSSNADAWKFVRLWMISSGCRRS
jgi:hypothetical protein